MPFGYSSGGFLGDIVYQLQYFGILDVILPFFLIFTVVFAILQKVGIFVKKKADGTTDDPTSVEEARKYNAIIALAIGLLVVLPHTLGYYEGGVDPVVVIGRALPEFAIAAVGIVMLLILLGIGTDKLPNTISKIISIASVFVVLYILYRALTFGAMPWWIEYYISDSYFIMWLVVILVFGLAVRAIMSPPEAKFKDKKGVERSKTMADTFEAIKDTIDNLVGK